MWSLILWPLLCTVTGKSYNLAQLIYVVLHMRLHNLMLVTQCWWHNFPMMTSGLRQLLHNFRIGAQNKSAFTTLIICKTKNCHQHFISPTSMWLWLRYNLYHIKILDLRLDFFLSYRAMFRCCMNTYQLQLQYRLGILLRSGLEMYNMILHIHTCLDMLYLGHVHHMRPFIELYLSVNRSNWPVSVNRLE